MPLRSTSGSEPVPPRPICLPLVLLFSSFLPERNDFGSEFPLESPLRRSVLPPAAGERTSAETIERPDKKFNELLATQ